MKIAVYGTLRKGFGNHERLMGACTFERMALTKPEYVMFASGIPYVIEGGQDAVTVEVYEVPDSSLPALDSLEGHPWMYERTSIQLEDGSDVSMYLYQVGKRVVDGDFITYVKEEEDATT